MATALRISFINVAISLVVLGLKFLAWWVTGSLALYSDAMESIVNVASAMIALTALWLAQQPADANHPFGHHKAEYLSAVVEGVLIVLAALAIIVQIYHAHSSPHLITYTPLALGLSVLAGLVNFVWARLLIKKGRELKSPALQADGHHVMSDVISSGGVLIGVGLAVWTGWWWLDAALALVVAVNILWSGWRLMRESIGGLMDEAVSNEEMALIQRVIDDHHTPSFIEIHDLRTRHAGPVIFIEFHLVVDGDMSVEKAHAMCDRLEDALRKAIGRSHITIHVEPEHKAHHKGKAILF
jgi:cation diffusion facilitator family transporter